MSSSRIVVGVDGSSSSAHAVAWAARQAKSTGAELHAVAAWNWAATYGYVPVGDFDWEAETLRMLDGVLEKAVDAGQLASVHRHVTEGHPAQVLLDAGEGAELLVVGNRGHGGFAGMLLGSVSQYLVTHAHCPVVVVRDADS
jgi:nucleotide-binding universal stress UspA family protein